MPMYAYGPRGLQIQGVAGKERTTDFLHRLAQSTICNKGGSKNPTNLDLLSLGSNVVVEQGGAGSDLARRQVASRWKTSN